MRTAPSRLDGYVDDGVAANNGRILAAGGVERVVVFDVSVIRVFQVNGNEQNFVLSWDGTHNFFSPVAVMRVEIKYGNALAAALESMNSTDGDAVEYAKTAANTVLKQTLDAAVMTRRPHDTEGVLALAVEHRIDSSDDSTGSVSCSVVTSRGNERVATLTVFSCALGRTMQSNLNARGERYRRCVTVRRPAEVANKVNVFDVVHGGDFRNRCG